MAALQIANMLVDYNKEYEAAETLREKGEVHSRYVRLMREEINSIMIKPNIFLPKNEMQYVVNCAKFYLKIHSAILYGLMDGQLPNADLCVEWLSCGEKVGIFPDQGFVAPEFKIVKKIRGTNQYCETCKICRRFDLSFGIFKCNKCKSTLNL